MCCSQRERFFQVSVSANAEYVHDSNASAAFHVKFHKIVGTPKKKSDIFCEQRGLRSKRPRLRYSDRLMRYCVRLNENNVRDPITRNPQETLILVARFPAKLASL